MLEKVNTFFRCKILYVQTHFPSQSRGIRVPHVVRCYPLLSVARFPHCVDKCNPRSGRKVVFHRSIVTDKLFCMFPERPLASTEQLIDWMSPC